MYHRLIYIISITAFSSEGPLGWRQLHSVRKSWWTQRVSALLSSSLSCEGSSKRGHPTEFQRETRHRCAHTQSNTQTGMLTSHATPTQGTFRAGPLYRLSLQGGWPLHPSCHPALTSAHLTRGPGSQRNTQRWTWGQRDHGCDWPLIKGSSVDDANWVRGWWAHWGQSDGGRVGADGRHQRGEGTWRDGNNVDSLASLL